MLKSFSCRKCHSQDIEVIDYEHAHVLRFSDHSRPEN
jgi:hypothetical protein